MHAQLRFQSDVEHGHVMVRLNHGQKNGMFSFFPCAWNFLRLPEAYYGLLRLTKAYLGLPSLAKPC